MNILASLAAKIVSYYKAILSRSMFSMHALVAVWRTTVIMGTVYWALVIGVVMLVMEYFVTMWVRMGEEWPWISPSTLCYLITTVAALWVQKLESLGHIKGGNGTYIATLPSTGMKMDFSAADWLLLTEQTMMVTIILSRWLLPKGTMSHKDLSSLLLLYLALSADILDFSTIFNEASVVRDKMFCYVILVVWTGSLAQFVLVLTNTASVDKENTRITWKSIVCSSEIWQILVQIGLQDLPFLLIRVIALVQYQVFNFTIIFFVCKNTLVICLELYHLIATCVEQQRKLKKRKERMKHLKSKMVSVKKAMGLSKLKGITNAMKGGGDDRKTDQDKDGDGDVKDKAQNNTLSLIASKLAKTKQEREEQENVVEKGRQSTVPTENESSNKSNNILNGSILKNPGLFAVKKNKEDVPVSGKATPAIGDTKTESGKINSKPVSQSLLQSVLKKPILKDVQIGSLKGQVENKSSSSVEEHLRSGSKLARENNFVNKPSPFSLLGVHKDGLNKLKREDSNMSIPPVSHMRQFRHDRDDSTKGSPELINSRSSSRTPKTRQSIFDNDDDIF